MKQRPTIKDVAKRAKVSLSTVSLVINNKGYVSQSTREKVERVIRELGYHPTRSARDLALRKSGNIGFILTNDHFTQSEPFYTKIFLGAEFEAQKHDYYILLTTVEKKFDSLNSIPRFLKEQNVDGVLIAGQVSIELIAYISSMNIPIVLIDYDVENHKHSTVLMNNYRGTQLAVEHLLELGHKEIGFLGGDLDHPSIYQRYLGYKDSLDNAGIIIKDSWISAKEPDTKQQDGYNAARAFLNNGESLPTAIIAANDAMAIGCLRHFTEAGIKVPDDISLIGFDNIERSYHVKPPLTTIDVNKFEMGETAVRTLTETIINGNGYVNHIKIPVTLIVRESTDKNVDHHIKKRTHHK